MSADPHAVVVWQRPGNGQAYPISVAFIQIVLHRQNLEAAVAEEA
jgi:hypothetical protein